MATKKYVLKKDEDKPADGTLNAEHIRDIIDHIEISFENIQDDIDICMQVYKAKQEMDVDRDTLDAISVACENAIEIEKQAGEVMTIVEQFKQNLGIYDKSGEGDLKILLKQMLGYEKQTKKIMEGVI